MTGNISSIKNLFVDNISSHEKIVEVSEKIFDKLDKIKDGNLSISEQRSAGLSFAGKPLSKKDFQKIYIDFAEKSLNTKTSLKDFDESPSSIVPESLRKEVIKRFELARLTRDDLYKDMQKFIELKRLIRESSGLSYAAASKLLKLAVPYDNSKVQDGKIGFFKQGKLGDCWFLAQLMAYVSTPEGENNIRKRIKTNSDGTYTVTLQHPNLRFQKKEEKYTVTKQEIENRAKNRDLSSGDIDVQILEIAFERYLKKHLPADCHPKEPNVFFLACSGKNPVLLVHRALGYTDTPKAYIKNLKSSQIIEWKITPIDDFNGKVYTKPYRKYSKRKYRDFADVIEQNKYNISDFVVATKPIWEKACTIDESRIFSKQINSR